MSCATYVPVDVLYIYICEKEPFRKECFWSNAGREAGAQRSYLEPISSDLDTREPSRPMLSAGATMKQTSRDRMSP